MKPLIRLPIAVVAILALAASCASKPLTPAPANAAPGQNSIQAEATGFEPGGDQRHQLISFLIEIGSQDAVKSWTFDISGSKGIVFTKKGSAGALPDRLTWDGKDNAEVFALEGVYTAILTIDYGGAFSPGRAESKPFVFALSPPSAVFTPNPALFAYPAGGPAQPLQIQVTAKPGLAKIVGWTIDVYDVGGNLFKSLTGAGAGGKVTWDAKGIAGTSIPPATSYSATLTVTDEYGGRGVSKGSFAMADKPAAPAATLTTRRAGFSPTSSSVKNTIDILFSVPAKGDVSAWKAEIDSATKGRIRTFPASGANLPDFLRWDGKDDQGLLAAQGSYYLELSLSYGDRYKDTTLRSPAFSLITEAPTGTITVDPAAPVLAELGPKSPLRFTIQAKSAYAKIEKWTLSVLDRQGVAIAAFHENWPVNKVEWDGSTLGGGIMTPGTAYNVAAKVEDEYGNVGTLTGTIAVDALRPADEPSSIKAARSGFSPKGDGSRPSMDFALAAGDAASVSGWKVSIMGSGGEVVRDFSGTGPTVPGDLSWDGKTSKGTFAAEGSYSARLSIDYGVKFSGMTVDSSPFILDLAPPSAKVTLSSDLLSPDGDGQYETVTIGVEGSSATAKIVSWSLAILDPGSNPYISFKGPWPAAPIVWDGKGADGSLVESAADYVIVATLRDEFGNAGEARATIGTDIMAVKTAEGYRISVSSIVFKPFTADYRDVPPDRAERNLKTLDLLAAKLAKFPEYRIALEGHAVMINWDDKARGEAEQREILIPLSKRRADAIKDALVERGIAAARLDTLGLGAENPIVPDSDYLDRWKNRRVDFILLR